MFLLRLYFLIASRELFPIEWSSAPQGIQNNGECAVLVQNERSTWLQPELCSAEHHFNCVKTSMFVI